MIDPSLLSLLSKALESVISRALIYDPGTRAKLSKLDNSSICVDITDFRLWFIMHISDKNIRLSILPASSDSQTNFDIIVIGAFNDLIKLATKKNHSLSGSGVVVEGKVSLLEAIQDIAQNIDIDWEDALAQKLPTPIANVILGPFISSLQIAASNSNAAIQNTVKQITDYAQYESGLIVSTDEFHHLKSDINSLRENTDRLEAKIKQFAQGLM